MTKEQFKAESSYRVSMLTKKEYDKIDTIMLKKYQPPVAGLR